MRLRCLLTCCVLSIIVPYSSAAADSGSPAPAASSREVRGSLAAQLSGALLADVLAMGLTSLVLVPPYIEHYCDDPEGDGCTDRSTAIFSGAFSVGFVSRVALVGGLTAACSRPSGGQGSAWAAMLGAAPGAAVIFGSWFLPGEAYPLLGVALGHAATIAGSVAAYRASAKRRQRRDARPLTQLFPAPYVNQHGTAGLTWAGAF